MHFLKKTFYLLIIIVFILPVVSLADHVEDIEDDDCDYRWKTWRTRRSHAGFSGHGGFYLTFQPIDFGDLKIVAKDMNISIPDDGLLGLGGYGMGHIGNGWRLGGGGHGYNAKYTGIYKDIQDGVEIQYNRTMEIDIGGGGFIIEYSPWMIGPVNFGFGSMIGGGGVNISLHQDDGAFTWDVLTGQYTTPPSDHSHPKDNIVTKVETSYFLFNPYFTARFHILEWLAIEGSVAYNWNTLSTNNWKFGDRDIAGDGPDIDNKKLYYRLNLVIGG